MRLEGKVAIVSGTGPNIGQEIARVLASEGAKVVCADFEAENAERASARIKNDGGHTAALEVDIRQEEQVRRLVETTLDLFGSIDVLVNNAAVTVNKGLLDMNRDEWQRCIDVNLTGTFHCCQQVARAMVDNGTRGSIINIASTSGHRGRPNAVAYCSSKGGVLNMTRAIAMDLAQYGIRVNSVSPTRTGTSVGMAEQTGVRTAPEIPLGRTGEPVDQALAVLYLASGESSFVTGIDLRVDGGALATWGVQENR